MRTVPRIVERALAETSGSTLWTTDGTRGLADGVGGGATRDGGGFALEEVREAGFAAPDVGEEVPAVVRELVLVAGVEIDPAELGGTEIEAGPDEVAGIFVAGAEEISGAEDVALELAESGEDAERERRK